MMSPKQSTTNVSPEMTAQIAELQQLVIEKEEAHKRALADYHNLVRRSAEERKALIASANENILTDLLPTLDHLEMALQHFQDSSLEMILSGLKKTLEKYGLRRIETVGESFDPQTMEAVDTAPGKEGEVIREQRAGYWLQESVLRHAEVIVGTGK